MEPFIVLSAALACLAVTAAIFGLRTAVLAPRNAVLERAKRVTRVAVDVPAALPSSRSLWALLLGPLASLARPKQADEMSRAQKKLTHAGLRGEHATEIFFGSKVALGLILGGGLLALSAARAMPIPNARLYAVFLVAIGFYAPNVWLSRKVTARQTAISQALADALDLLVTCVEAGLGLDAALARIADEMVAAAPILASELRQTTMEIQAGVVRAAAFRRLAERTGVEDLRGLSAMIIQTEMFGTPIARALRIHSASMRMRRSHLAEEKGATASVKMMLPMVLCILPSLFSVILGPGIVRIVTALLPSIGGQH
jgi:tight adherence protein C